MKINNFRGELTDNSAKKEALVAMPSKGCADRRFMCSTSYTARPFNVQAIMFVFGALKQDPEQRHIKYSVWMLTTARQLKNFFRMKHRILYDVSTRLQILESVWMFRGHTVEFEDYRKWSLYALIKNILFQIFTHTFRVTRPTYRPSQKFCS